MKAFRQAGSGGRVADLLSFDKRHLASRWRQRVSHMVSVLVVTAGMCRGVGAAESDWLAPWSADGRHPVMEVDRSAREAAVAREDSVSYGGAICRGSLTVYQKYLSVVVASHCPLRPSCSNYSIRAIEKHGVVMGIVLTADRLLHEADEQTRHAAERVGMEWICFDPVENNDFWWFQP